MVFRDADDILYQIRGPAIKSGRSFMTAWAPLQICRKYFVLTSETIPPNIRKHTFSNIYG